MASNYSLFLIYVILKIFMTIPSIIPINFFEVTPLWEFSLSHEAKASCLQIFLKDLLVVFRMIDQSILSSCIIYLLDLSYRLH